MEVVVAKSAGFCWGVRRAVAKARALASTARAPVYSDGPLIHNAHMLAQLRREGIQDTADAFNLAGGTLLIRAHGIAPHRRAQLRALPVRVVDTTCPHVARIQGLIKREAAKGAHVIVFGDPQHPEVVGLLGYTQGRGHVVRYVEDVAALPKFAPVCLFAQSTQSPEDYQRIAAAVRERFPQVHVFDTICEATKERQSELVALARRVDAFVVVGDPQSANTLRLLALARSLRPAFHVETAEKLPLDQLRHFARIGLTAGASTPDFLITAVREALEALPGSADRREAGHRSATP